MLNSRKDFRAQNLGIRNFGGQVSVLGDWERRFHGPYKRDGTCEVTLRFLLLVPSRFKAMVKKSRSRAKDVWADYHALRGELCILPQHTFEREVLQVGGGSGSWSGAPFGVGNFMRPPEGKVAVCSPSPWRGAVPSLPAEFVNVLNYFGIVPMQLPRTPYYRYIYFLYTAFKERFFHFSNTVTETHF
ncbi:hypothetical protein AXF42_Ash017188 [Apostasia shenzhenica]|uniref:Uncharacterized protein n=1 Tax=Apostasia shenzhenica TaxID=1088818 RepID=A0A2H9ZVE2_9ASPA|nr:hypothetical protein AXF42_Ash017188 [Apostasia shenzhenica]